MRPTHHLTSHHARQAPSGDKSADQSTSGGNAPADVLVIDDDPAIVDLLISLLVCEEELTVRGATSAAAALAWHPPAPPAVIFLDLTIPGERAAETIRALRARPGWARVPIVICTGVERPAMRARALGAAQYLAKPFDLDAVAALARRYVTTERTRRESGT